MYIMCALRKLNEMHKMSLKNFIYSFTKVFDFFFRVILKYECFFFIYEHLCYVIYAIDHKFVDMKII
jgi:hypothetical protein